MPDSASATPSSGPAGPAGGGPARRAGHRPGRRGRGAHEEQRRVHRASLAISHLGAVFLPINFRLGPTRWHTSWARRRRAPPRRRRVCAAASDVPRGFLWTSGARHDSRGIWRLQNRAPMHLPAAGDLFRLMYTSGHHRPAEGRDAQLPELPLEVPGPRYRAGPRRATAGCSWWGPLYHVGAFDLPGMAVLWVGGMICCVTRLHPGRCSPRSQASAHRRLAGAGHAQPRCSPP